MKAVVLAAGQGVRMLPLTKEKPKALVELKGKPLLQHVLESLEKAGVKKAIIVVGFKGELVRAHFGKAFKGMKLRYVEQRIPMGTAHAVLQAKGKTGKRFLVAYCDVIVNSGLWKKLMKEDKEAVVALREEAHPERFGVALVEGKLLRQIVEKPKKKMKSNLVNLGACLFSNSLFPVLEKTKMSKRGEFELTDSINALAAKDKVGFAVYRGKCLDIGTIKDLRKCER
ncbi:MAG: NTP transferase domain-containing protein [Candidatus Diapherotrites archaeon]|uniref:NTP transferase domain-containing protein n=1 Tax=Candidatus Iainarchaeum sp. TaxID=3101447 RepID=A0A938YX68_9ARCH|nr:NTP transferase domain-containing protein [Candidatus Diapherotrites archaeon]